MTRPRIFNVVVGVAAAAAVALTGCSSKPAETKEATQPTTSVASALAGTDSAACTYFRDQPVSAEALLVPVVVDRTGSARDLDLAPELAVVLSEIQATGAAIQTIGVNGSGVPPTLGEPIALDPVPGKTSRSAAEQRTAALGCVDEWLNSPDTVPIGDNTDLLSALAAAVRQDPSQIVVISDGVNTTSELNLAAPPSDPGAAAEQIRDRNMWASPEVPVHWFHMAETDTPITEPHRHAITEFWSGLLGDDLQLHTRAGADTGE